MKQNAEIIKDLIEQLNNATIAYDAGQPIMSDQEWDNLYFQLIELERETGIIYPNSPTQSISYVTINELTKVKHNHPMLSLDKTKDWNEFLRYFDIGKDVVGMPKMDGMTCSLRYLNGDLVSAESRGNGEIGSDILHHIKVMKNVPQHISYKEELIVDGEIICTYHNFEKFESEFANPRNMVAGSMNLLDARESARRNLQFVAWYVPKGPWATVIESFVELDNLGFEVVPWTSSFDWDADEFLKNKATELGYPIDGLVGRYNDIAYGNSLGSTGHHSRAAYAFKFYDEVYVTTLLDIEWSMGRSGKLTPVAIFLPVDTGDSIVTRANIHNFSIMNQLSGNWQGIGDTLLIFKANDIIPQVQEWHHNELSCQNPLRIPDKCPCCGYETGIRTENNIQNLVCLNPNCEGKFINKLDNFCGKRGLDIKGLSKATLEKLIEWDWVCEFADLYKLHQHRDEWIEKPGFGQKSVDNILNAIEESKETNLEAFISAIGIPLIGRSMSKELVKHIKTYEQFRELINNSFDFSQFDSFAENKTKSILTFNYEQADKVYNFLKIAEPVEEVIEEKSLDGMVVCVTGSLASFKNRGELAAAIEAKGGKVVNSISRNTNFLITNNPDSGSSKNVSARKYGTEIITEAEFIARYL